MRAIETLKRDHKFFCWCLRELEFALERPDARERLLLLTDLFATRLRRHNRREGRLIVLCSRRIGRFGGAELARFSIDHDVDRGFLQVVRYSVRDAARFSPDNVRLAVRALVAECRAHIEEQEAELFPLLQRVMGTRPLLVRRPPRFSSSIAVTAGVYPSVVVEQWPSRAHVYKSKNS